MSVLDGRVAAVDPAGGGSRGEREWWHGSPCAHLVLDAEAGLVLEANDTFGAWSGLRREEVVGTEFARLLPVGDRILWTTHGLPRLIAAGRVAEVSVQVVGAGGTRRAAFLSATRLDGAGDDRRVVVALFGAAERRRYEEELLESRRRAEASEARRAQAEQHLHHLVQHDPVTGLLNRSGLEAALGEAIAAVGTVDPLPENGSGTSGPLRPTVLFIDLDGFKAVNDSVGHAGGDELLAVLGARLRAAAREAAVVARFAGDEFVVLDHLRGEADAVSLCERLLAALGVPVVVHGVEVVVSASVGIAFAEGPVGGSEAELLDAVGRVLHRADAAMYRVKGDGRSGWSVHDPGAVDLAADRLLLLQELRHALTGDQLRLHFQPRVRLHDGCTSGVEALVRWQHPTRGLLAPAAFIDVAEASGLIRELGAWVLDAAVRQAARWNARGAVVQMSVNISARQLNDPGLVAVVTAALARHGVPASQIVLEITETALMLEPEIAHAVLQELVQLGVRVAVDDFGTGYAGLIYLQRFPVHELKVDRSFVAGVVDSARDRAIVSACVHLARALGLVSVAEGVETAAQREVLLAIGCDVAQGYLFARPRPAGELP